jgi:hypothetical protein
MEINLSVRSDDVDEGALQNLKLDLCADLNREADVEAMLAEGLSSTSTKGVITTGAIILTLVGGRGVIARLIGVLKAYAERGNRLEFELEKQDGTRVALKTENFRPGQIEEISKTIAEAFGVSD